MNNLEANKEKLTTAYQEHATAVKWCISAVLAFGVTCILSLLFEKGQERLTFTNSVWSAFVFLVLCVLFRRPKIEYIRDFFKKGISAGSKKKWILPSLFGFFFSVCMVVGAQLDKKGSVSFTSLITWGSILGLAVLVSLFTKCVWEFIAGRAVGGLKADVAQENEYSKKYSTWLTSSITIFLLYFIVFLAVYPGFFVYDAQDELLQVITRNFSTHHPLFHVVLLGGIIQLVHKISGSYNLGIACYTLFQMAVMSGIFGWCVYCLRKQGMKKVWGKIFTFYFGICPVLVMFSLCSAKDGLFTGMLLIMVLLLRELCKNPEMFLRSKRQVVALVLSSVGMMLLRHNGFYAFVVFALFLIVQLRAYWKKIVIFLGATIAAYMLLNAGIVTALHADASESQEMLTVPISQLARVYNTESESLPDEDLEILYRYLSSDVLMRYTPKVSDGVKIDFNSGAYREDKGSFLKLWLKWGTKHPFTYLNAWFMTSYGFWYPDTVIDVYRGNSVFTYTYEDSSYFGYEVEEPGERQSKIPWLSEIYRKLSLEVYQQRVPVVSMLFSPGFMFWITMFCLGFLGYMGRWDKIFPYMIILLCWLTVILGPTYLVRYVVYLWAVIPVLLWEVREGMSCV